MPPMPSVQYSQLTVLCINAQCRRCLILYPVLPAAPPQYLINFSTVIRAVDGRDYVIRCSSVARCDAVTDVLDRWRCYLYATPNLTRTLRGDTACSRTPTFVYLSFLVTL
jgi:hypothetical protein